MIAKISNAQIYKRFQQQQNRKYSMPIEGAEPNLIDNLSRLLICPKCLQPYGNIRLPYGQKVKQRCYCDKVESHWRYGMDFSTAYETCYCCGLEVITSGIKWSSFFCKDCKKAIYKINEVAGRCVIPVGRHSLMNGIWFNKSAQLDEAVSAFVGKVNSLGNLIGNVKEHKVLILRHQLKVLQLPENASLLELTKASFHNDRKQAKREALQDMVEHTLQSPIEKNVETPISPPKIESEFTAEPEISCVFYTMVIRNEAINQKYEGGLKAFVSEHLVKYNDSIAVMLFMGSDNLYDASEMLQNKGLKWEEDFTYFDATAMSRKKPKVKIIPFEVQWLKGYCSKNHAHVSLVRQRSEDQFIQE